MEPKIIYRLIGTLTIGEGQAAPEPDAIDRGTLTAPRKYQQLTKLPAWARPNADETLFLVTETPSLFDGHSRAKVKVYEAATPKPHTEENRRLRIIAEMLCNGESLAATQRKHNLGHSTINAWMADLGLDTEAPKRLAQEKAEARKARRLEEKVATLKKENTRLKTLLKSIKDLAS